MTHDDDARPGQDHVTGDNAGDAADERSSGPSTSERVGLGTQRSDDEPAWTRLLTPLRSEDAAFRALLVVAAVCGAFAAVVLLVRALS